jgi:hypothetical protein
MWTGPVRRTAPDPAEAVWKESWWLDGAGSRHSVLSRIWKRISQNSSTERKRFRIPVWHAWESALRLTKDSNVYVFTFAAMVHSNDQRPDISFVEFKPFLRYWVARFAPFYNFFGWSPTWEWTDIWNPNEADQIMRYVHEIDPWKRLLSIHDCSHSRFRGWLGFSMRQWPSRTLFMGNSRTLGARQGSCDGEGGIGSPFMDKPIVASEDVWESANADHWPGWPMPRNRTEVRRGIWGIQMAGVMPLYSEWANSGPPPPGGNGEGEPDVRRMFDFFYSKTRYRQYRQLNHLVSASAGQIASGIPGEEYLVYDEDGGSIAINLTGASSSRTFSVLWYDPKTGAEQSGRIINGGASRTLTSPFSGDTVLLLRRDSTAVTAARGADWIRRQTRRR